MRQETPNKPNNHPSSTPPFCGTKNRGVNSKPEETSFPIIVDAMRTNDTRLRAKRNAQLSKIDLQLLDQQFKPIENSQMSAFSVILLVRRTKKLVV